MNTTAPRFQIPTFDAVPQSGARAAAPRRPAQRFTFKFGSTTISVPYQQYSSGRTRYWMIFYYDAGRRRRESRVSYTAAKDRARQIALNILNGQTAQSQFTEADRAQFLAANENLAGLGQSILSATAEHARREKILKEKRTTFDELVSSSDLHRPRMSGPMPLPKVVQEFLAEKAGQLSQDHYHHRTHQLQKLSTWYTGPIHALQRVDLDLWLRSLGVGPITRKSYRDAARELVQYAETCGYIGPNNPILAKTRGPRLPAAEIKILSPDQVTALLRHASDSLVPFLCLQCFAGLRHIEVKRLDWRDVHLDDPQDRFISIGNAVAKNTKSKSGDSRVVPIPDNLAAWLAPHAKSFGPICRISQVSGALTKAKRAAGIPGGRNETKNVLRKTWISHRLGLLQDWAKTAFEAGNSPGVIRKYYGRPISKAKGGRLFTIWPTSAGVAQAEFAYAPSCQTRPKVS